MPAGRKPTHQGWLVEDRGDQQEPLWEKVPAVGWSHRDNKGLDVMIKAGVALTGRIVFREINYDASERPEQRPAQRREPGPRR